MATEETRESWIQGLSESQIEEDGLKIYQLRTNIKMKNEVHRIQVLTIGCENAEPIKSVLLLGETGNGKTHLISGFINHIFGVRFEDPFRLRLKDQLVCDERHHTESQTDYITAYVVYHQQGILYPATNFMFIDTPGFFDTRGEDAFSKLNTFFMEDFGIDNLDCIGVTVKANQNRIIHHQVQILKDITSLLGKDCNEVIHLMCTFACDDFPVVEVAKRVGIDFIRVGLFDNYPLFQSCHQQTSSARTQKLKMRWEDSHEVYCSFFEHLRESSSVDVKRIRELCMKRQSLKRLKEQLFKTTDHLSKLLRGIDKNKADICDTENRASNIKWKTPILKERRCCKRVEGNFHFHNCKICDKSCRRCEDPSNKKAVEEGFNGGLGVAAITGMGTSLASGAVIGSSVGMFGGPVGVILGSLVGGISGLTTGLAIAAKEMRTMRNCRYPSTTPRCRNEDCNHSNTMDHEASKDEIIIEVSESEVIDQKQKTVYDFLMMQLADQKRDEQRMEQELSAEAENGRKMVSDLESLANDISQLSLGSETTDVRTILQEIEDRSRDPFCNEALHHLRK